jgi:phage gp36-like protein
MSNEIHAATIESLNIEIGQANQQLNAALIGNGGDVTKIRRKLAALHADLSSAQKLADEAHDKAQADAAKAIDADTAAIGAQAVADVNAVLAAHCVTERLPADIARFERAARNIAIANHEFGKVGAALDALQEKANHVGQLLSTAGRRHAELKVKRIAGDTSSAAELYALSLDIESLTALHAEAEAKCDTIDIATPRAAIDIAHAALTTEKNTAILEHLFAHTQKAEAAFVASLKSLVGFKRGSATSPMERTAKVFSIYRLGDDLDWLNRTGALRA